MNNASPVQADDPIPPSAGPTVASTAGYFVVAMICSVAGYAVGNENVIPPTAAWPHFELLAAFLFPAYINRAMLYEQASAAFLNGANRRRWQRRHSWTIPLIVLLALLLMCVLGNRSLLTDRCAWLAAIATAIPLYALSIAATAQWPTNPQIYDFTFRSFFPAFATCLPTFVFGFVGCDQWRALLASSVTVLLFWALARQLPTKPFARIGIIALAVAIALLVIFALWYDTPIARWLQASTFGLLLTLAMGVSEAWRVTSRILHGTEFRPTPYSADEFIYYRGGTNAATALFLPCFVITAVHPATNRAYLWCVLTLLIVGYAAWFIDRQPQKSKRWPIIGVLFGLALPIVVSLCTRIGDSVPTFRAPDESLSPIAAVISISAILSAPLIYFSRILQRRLKPGAILLGCISARVCVAITGATASAVLLLIGAIWIIVKVTMGTSAGAEARIAHVYVAYLTIIVLCLLHSIISWITRLFGAQTITPSDATQPDTRTVRQYALLPNLWYAFQLTRPTPSLAAGLLAFAASGGIGTPFPAVASGMAMMLVTMFGFVVNDIFDEEKDVRAGVRRPLAMKVISRPVAIAAAVVTCLSAHLLATRLSPAVVAGTAALCIALLFYTAFARRLPVLKGVYTAVLACGPFWYGHLTSGRAIGVHLYVILAVWVFGRELLMDVVERDDDFAVGMRTIPFVIGVRRSTELGIVLVGGAAAALLLTATSPLDYVLAGATAVSLTLVASASLTPAGRISATRPIMLIGALALVAQLQ
jgi:geranylgeranylglycerol-phosphate geranylgeranyltransferase